MADKKFEICSLFFLFLLVAQEDICSRFAAMAGTPVRYLPAFQGPLPFELETGYIGVGQSEEVQLFYYFIKSESNPEVDPVILWLVGGPGCSTLYAIANEIGPLRFDAREYNGSLPTLSYHPYGYTKVANIIFLDSPVETGFSYATNQNGKHSDPLKASEYAHEFLLKSLETHCGGEYEDIDPRNFLCLQHVNTFKKLLKDIYEYHILEPVCERISTKVHRFSGQRRSLNDMFEKLKNPSYLPDMKCRDEWLNLSIFWANDNTVQQVLHVQKGSIREWKYWNKQLSFTMSINNTIPYHAYLSTKSYRSLIYSGDHDLNIPYQSTQSWIRSLNYSIVEDWRPWKYDGQVAGYTRTYSNGMTFATLKGSGHTAPEWTPAECLAMLKRWLSHEPL